MDDKYGPPANESMVMFLNGLLPHLDKWLSDHGLRLVKMGRDDDGFPTYTIGFSE